MREQGKTDYVVDIHSGDGRADPDWRAAGLIQADTYDSFDPVFQKRINKFAESSLFPTFRTVHYVPRNHLMPKGIVDIELEFLPPNISLRRARQYGFGLIRALC